MIFLRSALFNLLFFGITAGLSLVGTAVRLVNPERVMSVAILWARLNVAVLRFTCDIRLEVVGREHLPKGAALIASRHQSAFDTMVWLTLVPRCCYVLKHELLRIPLFGKLIQATRMIAVDRTGGGATLRSLLREGERAVREARQIVIFPEGTRSQPDSILPLQPGVAALASRTGLAVIPVVTNSGMYWGRRAFRKRPGTIRIVIRPPLPGDLRKDELMVRLREQLTMPIDAAGGPVDKSVGGAFPELPGRPK
jgi:1-acyl-sn-glycerol-3-phosphate acyltransferase